ncbi:MAG: hypothetical protein ACREOE_19425, partial [Gemmatimonadales bacterium]
DVWQVQQMSVDALARLVGSTAAELKWRADGHGGTTLTRGRMARSISRETTLAHDARDPGRLEPLLTLLTARVANQLREEGLMARTVTLKLRHGDFRTVTRRRTLDAPTDLDAELTAAALALFRSAFTDTRAQHRGVRLIGIAASNLLEGVGTDLFEVPARRRERELTRAVDRVRERFGFDAVTPAQLVRFQRRSPPAEG